MSAHVPKSPEERAAAVREVTDSCRDVVQDCGADKYARSRGITATLPDAIKCRPHAFGKYGALVGHATDANGNVLATHQVYLTRDGKRPHPDLVMGVAKRTNSVEGWLGKAVVRLPGSKPATVCEGLETGLSVWQATGFEVWVCLGSSFIKHAPVPDKGFVLIARDGDEPGSEADKDIDEAIRAFKQRDIAVAIATPPEGMDFNDVLVQHGEDAVRQLLDQGIDTPAVPRAAEASAATHNRPILARRVSRSQNRNPGGPIFETARR